VSPSRTAAPPSVDAAVEIQPEDDAETTVTKPDAELNWERIGRGFDWEGVRKRVEQARVDRKGQSPHNPCTSHGSGQICELSRISLAARGRVEGKNHSLSIVVLDVGSEDGVTEYHWAAVLDGAGNPVTKYRRVETLRPRECAVQLALEGPIPDARVALIIDPPPAQRASQ
jgi:hypothetical protein